MNVRPHWFNRFPPLAAFGVAVILAAAYLGAAFFIAPSHLHLLVASIVGAVWQHLATRELALPGWRRKTQLVAAAVLAPGIAVSLLLFTWVLAGGQM